MEKHSKRYDFLNHDSEELYYFLGLIAADGYISSDRISLELNDKDMVIRLKNLIDPNLHLYHREKTNSLRLYFTDKQYAAYLHEIFGMTTNQKSKELKFPNNIPDKYLKDFIRGYVDGDGCIDTTNAYRNGKKYPGPRLRILSTLDFLTTLNEQTKRAYPHKINKIRRKDKNENVYTLDYNFATAKMLLKWLYEGCSICLQRKYNKAQEVTGNFSTTVKRYSIKDKCIKIHDLGTPKLL